jgi:hypothetical protein
LVKNGVQWALVITGGRRGAGDVSKWALSCCYRWCLPWWRRLACRCYVGVPMVTALSVTHCFLPPHRGDACYRHHFEANLGLTLLYGMIITSDGDCRRAAVFETADAFEKAPPEVIQPAYFIMKCRASGTVFSRR